MIVVRIIVNCIILIVKHTLDSVLSVQDPDADVSSDKEEEEQGVKDMNTSAESWESLAVDLELWDLLVLQLEDTLALNTMLHMNIPASEKDGDIGGIPADPIKLSVSKLLEGGRGIVVLTFCWCVLCISCSPLQYVKKSLGIIISMKCSNCSK